MTAGDIDHRGGVITPLCSEYYLLVYIEIGQTVLYFDMTQKKKKDPVIDPLLLPPIEILITSKGLIEFSHLYENHRVSTVQAGYFSY